MYAVAQVVFLDDGTVQFIDSQVLSYERKIVDTLRLKKPGWAVERRLAFKKLPPQPSLESELRRLLLPGFLQTTPQQGLNFATKQWRIDIETSDYVDPITSDGNTGGGTNTGGTTRPTDLNPLIYTASELETYTYYQDYNLGKINDNNTAAGVMKMSGGTLGKLKILITFNAPKTVNQISVYPGQFNGNFNSPSKLDVYLGNNETSQILTAETIDLSRTNNISTLNNPGFNTPSAQYTFVFSGSGSDNVSVNELDLFGA